MIRIGLTRFDNHKSLTEKSKSTLFEYAAFLPLVELDTAFYYIPKKESVENWVTQVPASFRFIIKAYSGLTKQKRELSEYATEEEMANALIASIQPLIDQNRLFCFLFQFPSYFGCTKENVAYLKKIRQWMGDLPIAVEFRNGSWYQEKMIKGMRRFMTENQFSLAIIDEPQVPNRSVPLDDFVTNPDFAMLRLHGRNFQGWQERSEEWQHKRTLYRYNKQELTELKQLVTQVQQSAKEVAVIFNNDSGGDAADNALALIELMGLDYPDLNPRQMELF